MIFFCIPKAANSSIKAAILKALGIPVTEDVPHKHPALNVQPAARTRAAKYKDYLRITVVRNPFDRLVSFWAQKICTERVKTQGHTNRGFYLNMPFDECIRLICADPRANAHYHPQAELMERPHFVGRIENLPRDWQWIRNLCRPLELVDLPHYNKSDHGNYRDYYGWKTRRLVENTYSEDLAAFGYSF